MRRTIEDLWSGNLAPCEHCGTHDPEINALFVLLQRNKDALSKDLSVPQQEILSKYIDCWDEYLSLMSEHAFCEGFSLASRLLTESLSGNW